MRLHVYLHVFLSPFFSLCLSVSLTPVCLCRMCLCVFEFVCFPSSCFLSFCLYFCESLFVLGFVSACVSISIAVYLLLVDFCLFVFLEGFRSVCVSVSLAYLFLLSETLAILSVSVSLSALCVYVRIFSSVLKLQFLFKTT